MDEMKIENLRRSLREAEQALSVLQKYGSDGDFADCTVLRAKVKFSPNGIEYTYLFLKIAENSWVSSSMRGTGRSTWDGILEFLGDPRKVSVKLRKATRWEKVA